MDFGFQTFVSKGSFPGCVDSFTKISDQNAVGAAQEPNANTRLECEAACLSKSRSDCAAYEFNRVVNTCWIHGGTAPTSLGQANGVDHYRREHCVQSGRCIIFLDVVL